MKAMLVGAVALCGLFALTSCGLGNLQDMRSGLPGDKQVKIALKGNADNGQALVDDETKMAGFYELTYGVTRGVNGMVLVLLGVTRWIINQPPSEQPDDDHAVWGPTDPEGLERIQYKATAERVEEGHFVFELLGRPKSSTDEADYKAIYSVEYYRAGVERGHGTITVDRDNHKLIDPLNDDICETGSAVVTFANDGADSDKVVDIDFSQLDRSGCSDKGQMGRYHYAEAEDGSGDFSFSASNNIHQDNENKPQIETMTIRSQWTAEGAGRSDVIVEGGEVTTDLANCTTCEGATRVVVSQCWDEDFISRYENTSPAALQSLLLPGLDGQGALNPTGDEAADCAFQFAEPAPQV
ncbi:MAG: hypothetical protein JXR83_08540 [Deltaproteobacteria bacterium]|nr:hypothetical protein [Deltaproteobacteria bacterium]